jgi:hypothetical protein
MKSLGIRAKSAPEVAMQSTDKQIQIRYPSFSLSSKVIPEIGDFTIGERIEMKIICSVKGLREDYSEKGVYNAELDMTKAEIVNLKADRKEANRKGLSMADFIELKKKYNKE